MVFLLRVWGTEPPPLLSGTREEVLCWRKVGATALFPWTGALRTPTQSNDRGERAAGPRRGGPVWREVRNAAPALPALWSAAALPTSPSLRVPFMILSPIGLVQGSFPLHTVL
jgi:hypothetical protein